MGMLFKSLRREGLGCLTHLLADERAGEAIVVDPVLDVGPVLDAAAEAGVEIRHVVDTHVHADHVSGVRALARETDATIHLPRAAAARFEHEPLDDGDAVEAGSLALVARHAPGHTPEHVVLFAREGEAPPYVVLTGDTLFVGSVGRPDLVADADARALAADLHATLARVLAPAPDGTLVAPGHGLGSACGSIASPLAISSLGYERATNAFLAEEDRTTFVKRVLSDLPPRPGNARALKQINRDGPPVALPTMDAVPALDPRAFARAVGDARDTLVLDLGEPDAFGANHVAGSVNVPISQPAFPARAAHLLELGLPVYLVSADEDVVARAVRALALVGGFDVRGRLEGGLPAWRGAGLSFATIAGVSAREARGAGAILDVRSKAEWDEGHAPGATWIPLEEVASRLDALDRSEAWTVTCGTGYRSATAASLLARAGFSRVTNLLGGMTAWKSSDLPLERTRSERGAEAENGHPQTLK